MLMTRPLPDAKSFLAIEPPPSPSHHGKKIIARSNVHYSCEEPTREQVWVENYERRLKQMADCGFRSVDYKPYRELEEVELDDRVLMLKAVGQHDREVVDEISVAGDEDDVGVGRLVSGWNRTTTGSPSMGGRISSILASCGPVMTPMIGGQLESLNGHLKDGRKRIGRVKQGHGLFPEIQEEERKRLELSQEAARKEQELRKSEWNSTVANTMVWNSSSEDDDDDDDSKCSFASSTPHSRIESVAADSTGGGIEDAESEKSVSACSTDYESFADEDKQDGSTDDNSSVDKMPISTSHSGSKLAGHQAPVSMSRKSMAHNDGNNQLFQTSHETFGTNASGEPGDADTVFRQLRSLQWLLEAMLQKVPGCMPPIMSTWQTRIDMLKKIDSKEIVETRKRREDSWEKLVTQHGPKKYVLLNPLLKTTNDSSSKSSVISSRHNLNTSGYFTRSGLIKESSLLLDTPPGMLMDEDRDAAYEATVALVTSGVFPSDITDKEEMQSLPRTPKRQPLQQPLKAAFKKSPDPVKKSHPVASLRPPAIMPRMTRGALLRHPSLTKTYPPNTQSAQPKPRPKSSPPIQRKLTPKQYEELVKLVEKPDYIHRRALAAIRKADSVQAVTVRRRKSNVSLPSDVPPILQCSFSPTEEGLKFDSVMKDKEVIVHEQLSAIQRDRYQTCRQKFMTLDGMQKKGKLWEDLETIRAGVATETAAMARRKLLMNYHWYHDLIMELPPGIQDDRFLAHILLRLRYLAKEFAELGPYRLSKNRLLRVLAHLRPWEREAPDIKKAIDFVRDHVIYTSLAEYEEYVAEREIAMATERRPKSATFVSLSKKAK